MEVVISWDFGVQPQAIFRYWIGFVSYIVWQKCHNDGFILVFFRAPYVSIVVNGTGIGASLLVVQPDTESETWLFGYKYPSEPVTLYVIVTRLCYIIGQSPSFRSPGIILTCGWLFLTEITPGAKSGKTGRGQIFSGSHQGNATSYSVHHYWADTHGCRECSVYQKRDLWLVLAF